MIVLLIPFQVQCLLSLSFSFSLARTSSAVFNSSGESSRHLGFFLDVNEKVSVFHH